MQAKHGSVPCFPVSVFIMDIRQDVGVALYSDKCYNTASMPISHYIKTTCLIQYYVVPPVLTKQF